MATCCATLASIQKACSDAAGNASGIKTKISIACVDHVESIPAAVAGVITGPIVMKLDTGSAQPGLFYEWGVSKTGGTYTFEPEGEEEDGFGTHVLTFFIPKMSAAKNVVLNGVRGGAEHIVIFQDGNAVPFIMGDMNEGATVAVVPSTNDRNGYTCTVRYRGAKLLDTYTGAIPTA